MKISELIKNLNKIKEESGDLEVIINNGLGEYTDEVYLEELRTIQEELFDLDSYNENYYRFCTKTIDCDENCRACNERPYFTPDKLLIKAND
jgi:hypothetical protein